MSDRSMLVAAVVAMALAVGSCSSRAGEAIMSWTPPVKNCDGTNITDLAGYRAYWSLNQQTIPGTATTTFTIKGLTPGTWWLNVAAYNSKGEESYFAGPVSKTVTAAEFVTVDTVAYTVVKRTDLFVLLPVGTIPKGTPCDATQQVNGKYVVPRGLVTWAGSVQPDVVVASCG